MFPAACRAGATDDKLKIIKVDIDPAGGSTAAARALRSAR